MYFNNHPVSRAITHNYFCWIIITALVLLPLFLTCALILFIMDCFEGVWLAARGAWQDVSYRFPRFSRAEFDVIRQRFRD